MRGLIARLVIVLALSAPAAAATCVDGDGDGYAGQPNCGTTLDCNDADPSVHPDAPEVCDARDNDCDGSLDEACDRSCDDPSIVTRLETGSYPSSGPEVVWGPSEFGLAWVTGEGGQGLRVVFQRYTLAGAALGPKVFLGPCHDLFRISAAWNGEQYGVTWEGPDGIVRFAALDGTGQVVVPAMSMGVGRHPAITWGGGVWGIASAATNRVDFRAVSPAGNLVVPVTSLSDGSPGSVRWPSIAWTGQVFGVIWSRQRGIVPSHFVVMATLSPEGSPVLPESEISGESVQVAWSMNWSGSDFAVVWDANVPGSNGVRFRRIAVDGTPLGPAVDTLEGQPERGWYALMASNGSEYGIVWSTQPDGDVYWGRVDATGKLAGNPILLAQASTIEEFATWQIVWTGTQYVVSWDTTGFNHISDHVSVSAIRCGCDGADADGDGSCGFADCNDADPEVFEGAGETCNGLDDDCDGAVDEGVALDSDLDGVHDACDRCPLLYDPSQSDFDHDGRGDLCDLDDGVVMIVPADRGHLSWQAETGVATWNVYEGSLDVLKATGVYTQLPGSNPLARRTCGVAATSLADSGDPAPGASKYWLVTAVVGGAEASLGSTSSGAERPNTNPCP